MWKLFANFCCLFPRAPLVWGMLQYQTHSLCRIVELTLNVEPSDIRLLLTWTYVGALSSVSSGLNSLASVLWEDFVAHSAWAHQAKDNTVSFYSHACIRATAFLVVFKDYFVLPYLRPCDVCLSVLTALLTLVSSLFLQAIFYHYAKTSSFEEIKHFRKFELPEGLLSALD